MPGIENVLNKCLTGDSVNEWGVWDHTALLYSFRAVERQTGLSTLRKSFSKDTLLFTAIHTGLA